MSETTKTCQVEMHDGKPCGREAYDGKYCIFHAYWIDKDVELFQKKLDEIFKDQSLETYDFTGFIFPIGIDFPKKFSKNVSFKSAKVKGGVHFEKASFEGWVNFDHATFKGEASFWEATFNGDADFSDAFFQGKADFFGVIFKGEAKFYGATFKGETDFRSAVCTDEAFFERATFDDALLMNSAFLDKKAFIQAVDFTRVKFLKPEKVEFQKLDLSKFRFLETDVRGVYFTDVDWHREKGKGRNKVFDEVSPDSFFEKFDYALIAQLYRRLRANYEENLRYSEAGDFYIGEMEMTRKAEKNIFRKFPLLFYKAISNYGESYYRPLGWIAAILLIFPLFFMFAGIQPISFDPNNPMEDVIHYRLDFSSTQSFSPTTEKVGDYYTCFLYSMSVFSFIRDKKYTTIDNWGHTLFVIESILSPVTLAFFLLALRRRFKR